MEDKPIRVLQCVSNMDRAGIETMLMNFYRNIDREKVQFDFLVNKSKPGAYDDEILKLGGKIIKTPGLNPLKFFKYQKFMKRLFEETPDYRIIHCQNEAMGFYALFAAKKYGVSVRISHSHNTVTRVDFKMPIKLFCKSQLLKVSNLQVACGIDAGRYLFKKNVKIIKNAIDTEKFIFNQKTREKVRSELDLQNKIVIGHVGRFEPQKNHKFIIDMFEKITKKNDNYVLLLLGDGSLLKKIKSKVDALKLSDKVIFLGNVPNVNEIYQAMDLFILPSLHEGLPVVGVEAQTADLKCFFSNKVTHEAKILDKTEFLELKSNVWVDKLLSFNNESRNNNRDILCDKGYDIKTEAKKLENWYINLYNNGVDYEN